MSTESAETPARRIADGYAVDGQALELGTVVIDGAADPRPRSASRWPRSTGTAWWPVPPEPARPRRCS